LAEVPYFNFKELNKRRVKKRNKWHIQHERTYTNAQLKEHN